MKLSRCARPSQMSDECLEAVQSNTKLQLVFKDLILVDL